MINSLNIAKRVIFKKGLPLHLVFFVTSKCSFHCNHCYYWHRINQERIELSLDEIEKIVNHLSSILSVSFTGGEPFLRKDLHEIVKLFLIYCKPRYIQFPTNAFFTNEIISTIEKILKIPSSAKVIINVSVDGEAQLHDKIRGVRGAFSVCMQTIKRLKELQRIYPRLSIYTATTCMSTNQNKLNQLFSFIVNNIKPDNIGINLIRGNLKSPEIKDVDINNYIGFRDNKIKYMKNKGKSFQEKVIFTKEMLESELISKIFIKKKYLIPCYAGSLFGIINEVGEVYPCIMKAESMGSLRSEKIGYDLNKIWLSQEAEGIRKEIKKEKCFCTYECAMTTSILFNINNYNKLLKNFLKN
ncbi:MAG: radical SAM/SPASM domain-containing protein [Candidatus Omnitrophota bacterium]